MVGKPGVVGREDAPKRFTSCLSFISKEDFLLEGGVEQRMKMTLGRNESAYDLFYGTLELAQKETPPKTRLCPCTPHSTNLNNAKLK